MDPNFHIADNALRLKVGIRAQLDCAITVAVEIGVAAISRTVRMPGISRGVTDECNEHHILRFRGQSTLGSFKQKLERYSPNSLLAEAKADESAFFKMELTWIAIAASLLMGGGGLLIFVWAVRTRQFHRFEDVKYQVFWSDAEELNADRRRAESSQARAEKAKPMEEKRHGSTTKGN